jgi:hypothetical protein
MAEHDRRPAFARLQIGRQQQIAFESRTLAEEVDRPLFHWFAPLLRLKLELHYAVIALLEVDIFYK